MRTLLLVLALLAIAQADPYRDSTDRVLQRKLDPAQYARLQPLLEDRFDARGELKLTRQEEADLKALFGPLLQKPVVPVVAPSPAPAR